MQGFASSAMAQVQMPEWKKGDKWEYEMSFEDLSVKYVTKVKDITTINVNNTNYNVFEVESSMSFMGGSQKTTNYHLTSDLSIVKDVISTSGGGSEETQETTYQPPKKDLNFPLTVGKKWTSTYELSNYDEEYGYSNYTESMEYEVVAIETITVDAGTYECYKIVSSDDWGFNNITSWYSPEVKNMAKISTESFGLSFEMELTSKGTEEEEGGFDLFAMPWLLLLILIPIILIILIVALVSGKRKRAKAKVPPSQTPKQPHATTTPVITPASRPPPPRIIQQPAQPPPKQYPCATCGQPLTYVQQYKRWYCNNCRKYA